MYVHYCPGRPLSSPRHAIKALAGVRRIQLPAVQLNVGERQVIIGR